MRYFSILLSFLLISNITFAEEAITLSMGQGYTHNQESGFFNLGAENYFDKNYLYKLEAGFWSDSEINHKSAFYSSFLLGRRFGDYTKFNASVLMGIAFMTAPDILLSTPFQFTEEVNIGYWKLQAGIKHFSNAGIKLPNRGRDYLYMRYIFPF